MDNTVNLDDDPGNNLPKKIELFPNYPNPFNPATKIVYQLSHSDHVRIDVFDMLGRHVITLKDRWQTAGMHDVAWDGTNNLGQRMPSGTYYYRIVAGSYSQTRKMILMK